MKKVLLVATVVRMHVNVFHIPMMKWFKGNGWKTYVAARNDLTILRNVLFRIVTALSIFHLNDFRSNLEM